MGYSGYTPPLSLSLYLSLSLSPSPSNPNPPPTQISPDTTDILIEVTGTVSLDTCKKTVDTLLAEMLEMGLGSRKSDELKVLGIS